MKKVKDYIKC